MVQTPTFRVRIWLASKAGLASNAEEYRVQDASSVDEVLHWLRGFSPDNTFEIFVESTDHARGRDNRMHELLCLTRIFGERPDTAG